MRKYAQGRYIPYLRTRYKARFTYSNANISIRNFLLLLRFIICITCFIFAMNTMMVNFHRTVNNICEYKAAQLVCEYIDKGVLTATSLFPGNDFIVIGRNEEGQVTSVETSAIKVNRFAAILSESILSELTQRQHEKIKAPIGSLSGNGLLSSLGFSIPYRIIPAGKVMVSPVSGFDSAGINQTIHRLKMDVEVEVKVLFPFMKKEETVNREVILSETVIIGDVPEILLSKAQ